MVLHPHRSLSERDYASCRGHGYRDILISHYSYTRTLVRSYNVIWALGELEQKRIIEISEWQRLHHTNTMPPSTQPHETKEQRDDEEWDAGVFSCVGCLVLCSIVPASHSVHPSGADLPQSVGFDWVAKSRADVAITRSLELLPRTMAWSRQLLELEAIRHGMRDERSPRG